MKETMARPSASHGTRFLGRAAYGGPQPGSANGGGYPERRKTEPGVRFGKRGEGEPACQGRSNFKKNLQIFLVSLRGWVDHLSAVVERVEIAKGINLDVSSLREPLQGSWLLCQNRICVSSVFNCLRTNLSNSGEWQILDLVIANNRPAPAR